MIRRRALFVALVVAPGLAFAAPLTRVDAYAAAATGTVYVVQGVADSPMTITVDGKPVATAAAAKTIVGPLTVSAGSHTITAEDPMGTAIVTSSVSLVAGANIDTVLHRQVDPSQPPSSRPSPMTSAPSLLVAVGL